MKFLSYLLDLFYPNLCVVCNQSLVKGEEHLCKMCLCELPKTNFHKRKDNLVEQRFWGKTEIERGSALLFFSKGSMVQTILHELKYKNNKHIGVYLGKLSGTELLDSEHFTNIDCITPVPLHEKKKQKRGYNQSEMICIGMAEVLGKPVMSENLLRIKESSTQTKKSVYERHQNVENIFEIKNSHELEGKHILIVDDVLTTGSTLEACITQLIKIRGVTISVFCVAIAI